MLTPEERERLLDQPVNLNSIGKLPSIDDLIGDLKKKDDDEVVVSSDTKKDDVADGDEGRVPASRFRKTRQELIELREAQATRDARDADIFSELARLREQVSRTPRSDKLPEKWIALYGDSEQSQGAYQMYQDQLREMLQSQKQELETAQEQRLREAAEQRKTVSDSIDDGMEDLEADVGKKLTDSEKEAILDVVERYSPENEDGTYDALIPLDKAYEIYEMEQAKKGGGAAKRRVAEIASAATEGEGGAPIASKTAYPSWDNVGKRWGL